MHFGVGVRDAGRDRLKRISRDWRQLESAHKRRRIGTTDVFGEVVRAAAVTRTFLVGPCCVCHAWALSASCLFLANRSRLKKSIGQRLTARRPPFACHSIWSAVGKLLLFNKQLTFPLFTSCQAISAETGAAARGGSWTGSSKTNSTSRQHMQVTQALRCWGCKSTSV